MIYKIAVLSYMILYTGVALILRSFILYRNTGVNPFATMGKEGIHGFNERVLMFGAMHIPVITLLYVIPNDLYAYLVPIPYLELTGLKNIGVVVMVIACLFSILAQFQMGNSWRIGINKLEKTNLIAHGLYRYSRNPIYLGLLISFLGFFLIVPTASSLCCLVLAYPSLEIKIRCEEQYLLEKHGTSYQNYLNQVRRWI